MNKIIVEGKNDKLFMEGLVQELPGGLVENYLSENEKIGFEVEVLGTDNKKALTNAIENALRNIGIESIKKIGVVIDLDEYEEKERLAFVNECIGEAFSRLKVSIVNPLEFVGQLKKVAFENNSIELGCFFVHWNGRGELSDVLKNIKPENQDSSYADCLEEWKKCLEMKNKKLTPKEHTKLWVDFYIRWDTCKKSDKRHAGEMCSTINLKYVMETKREIFDFGNESLNPLKDFLNQFS